MWFNECIFWASKDALYDWHMDTYHKHAKAWAANGAIMEDIITNFELVGTRLLCICPCWNELQDKRPTTWRMSRPSLREQCPKLRLPLPLHDRATVELRSLQ